MKDWIVLLGPLLGVIIGGGMTWLITTTQLRHQTARERKKLILEKLESLHETISDYLLVFAATSAELLKYETSGKPPDMNKLNALPKQRFNMLVGFYAAELEERRKEMDTLAQSMIMILPRWADQDKGQRVLAIKDLVDSEQLL